MNEDSPSSEQRPEPAREPCGQRPEVEWTLDREIHFTIYNYVLQDRRPDPVWQMEHDRKNGAFVLNGPDGKTERFRDRPLRYLVLDVDLETGELTPVFRDGRPKILSLCPEAAERR